jgi:hypothetical protein
MKNLTPAERQMAERHLVEADEHVARARQRIRHQARVARTLGRDGHAGAEADANRLLQTLRDSLRVMLDHRDLILRELGQPVRRRRDAGRPAVP